MTVRTGSGTLGTGVEVVLSRLLDRGSRRDSISPVASIGALESSKPNGYDFEPAVGISSSGRVGGYGDHASFSLRLLVAAWKDTLGGFKLRNLESPRSPEGEITEPQKAQQVSSPAHEHILEERMAEEKPVPTYIKLLSSGYWHVRFGPNRFVQWPRWRESRSDDVFGWNEDGIDVIAAKAVVDAR